MELKLNVKKEGLALSPNEVVNNEEFQLNFGHIFRGPKGDSGEKGDNGKSPKISNNGTWLVFSDELKTYVDTGIKASGSDNNYTDADQKLVQTIPDKVGQDEFNETVTGLGEAINDVGTVLAETKAAKDGYYPDMSVGMADNLVGRGDVQDAQISFRPSAGADNITDGAARIERIKGNSVVYNQVNKCDARKFEANGLTITFDESLGTFNIKGTRTGTSTTNLYEFYKFSTVARHKYLFLTSHLSKSHPQFDMIYIYGSFIGTTLKQDAIVESSESKVIGSYIRIKAEEGEYVDITDRAPVIDLTKEFGAGNEPTTYEEYLQRKPMNIEDEYAYNAGELVDMHADKIISTSDNAYDYTKHYARVMGGYKYDITANAGATLEVSFYADGEDDNEEREIAPDSEGKYTFPANGICYVNGAASHSDVCVCLNHSYNKPHPAYQQEVKDLSFIGEAFPNGMRSAGSTFDEIRFNPTKKVWEKVERVGVRAYVEGDAENSSVTTDGKTTNYPLDNPTPTTIDLSPNFNPDYLVWDFGTEEAIVPDNAPSAPFRADINYEPNAVDDLRWAVSEIRNLKAQLAQMSASVTNLNE